MNAAISMILGATLLTATSLPANAAPAETGDSVAVHFSDLDITTDKGAATLDRRIKHAADAVCGTPDIRDLRRMESSRSCHEIALNNARKEADLAMAAAKRGESYASAGAGASINVHSR